jgi:hypothetical protein
MYETGSVEFQNCPQILYTYYIRPKGVVFQHEWLDCYLFVRHCQIRRKRGMPEFGSLQDFLDYLHGSPIRGLLAGSLKTAIQMKKRIFF